VERFYDCHRSTNATELQRRAQGIQQTPPMSFNCYIGFKEVSLILLRKTIRT